MSFLAMAILSAQGFVGIRRILRKYRNAVSYLLLAGLLFDYHPHCRIGISLPEKKNRIYDIVRENIGEKKLLELPIWPGDTSWSSIYQYYVTMTRAGIINGYSPAVSRDYVQNTFLPLYPLDFGEMREEQYNLSKALNVKYVIGHAEAFPVKVSPFPFSFTLNNLKGSPYLRFLEESGPLSLFELVDVPPPGKKQKFKQSSIIGHIYEAERLKRRTGGRVSDTEASGGFAVMAEPLKGREGHMVFGPYRTFPSGRYVTVFRLKADGSRGGGCAAILDVCADKGERTLAKKRLKLSDFARDDIYQDFSLPFTVSGPTLVEFRVYHTGKTRLWADYVYVKFAGERDPPVSIEAEDLFHIAHRVEEKEASGGAAIFADSGTDPADYLISGPYRRYPAGKYKAVFRLKVGQRTSEPVAGLAVTKGYSRNVIAARTVPGTDFSKSGSYEEFSVLFTIAKPEVLEFLVFFEKKADLWIDSISIKDLSVKHR